MLPPAVYQERIQNSKIKAVAIVEKVKVTNWNNNVQYKKVSFKLVKSFSSNVPGKFTGHCASFKPKYPWSDKHPMTGGTIYRYPDKGEEALVVISSDGGSIHSYTVLTDELKKELSKNGLKNFQLGPFAIKKK